MTPEKEAILAKIKACLNLAAADSGTTEAEMAAALGRAKTLMEKHNLSEAEVLAHDPSASLETVEEVTVQTRLNPAPYENHLSMVCKELFSVEPLLFNSHDPQTYKKTRCIKFYGLPLDVQVAAAAFQILRSEINTMALSCGFYELERDHWRLGVVLRLRERAEELASSLTKEEAVKCRDLMVVKNGLIKQHIKEAVGETRGGRGRVTRDEAFEHGQAAGDAINLDFRGQVTGKGTRGALRLDHRK